MKNEGKNIPGKGCSMCQAPQPKESVAGETGEERGLENSKARVARRGPRRGRLALLTTAPPA